MGVCQSAGKCALHTRQPGVPLPRENENRVSPPALLAVYYPCPTTHNQQMPCFPQFLAGASNPGNFPLYPCLFLRETSLSPGYPDHGSNQLRQVAYQCSLALFLLLRAFLNMSIYSTDPNSVFVKILSGPA